MRYHFQVHKEDDGYWAQCVELPGCKTQGDSRAELDAAMAEALDLFLDEPATSEVYHPLPHESITGADIVAVPVAAEIALPLMVRHYRVNRGLNMEQAKEQLGFKHRTDYVRLEHRGNPTLQKIARIKSAWPDFPLEQCFSKNA